MINLLVHGRHGCPANPDQYCSDFELQFVRLIERRTGRFSTAGQAMTVSK
jgi:hypothetical protein